MSFFIDTTNFTEPNYVGNHVSYVPIQYANSHIHAKSLRRVYIDKITGWLEEGLVDNGVPIYGKRRQMKRKHAIIPFIDKIINIIHSSDFEIGDIDQLKEDIVHYIYRLTSIKN